MHRAHAYIPEPQKYRLFLACPTTICLSGTVTLSTYGLLWQKFTQSVC